MEDRQAFYYFYICSMRNWLSIPLLIFSFYTAFGQNDTNIALNRTVVSYDNWHKLPAADVYYDSVQFTIALYDANGDSIYNSPETDMVIIAPYKSDSVYTHIGCQATLLSWHKNVIVQAGKWQFLVSCVNSNANSTIYIKALGRARGNPDAQLFNHMPEFETTGLDGKKGRLKDIVSPNKYTYFFFWGKWCVDCIKALGELKKIDSAYGKRLTIIGMNFSDSDTAAVRKFVTEKGYNWPQLISNQRINEAFSQYRFPYGVLFAPGGTLIKQGIKVEQLKAYFTQIH